MDVMFPKDANGEIIDLSMYNPRQRTNIRMYGIEHADWIPQDVADYRRNWMSKSPAKVNVKEFHKSRKWLNENLYRHQWDISYTGPYQTTVFFEREEDAFLFKLAM